LAIGNIIAELISFVGFLYIARILGPENYGIYVTVGTFVGIFGIFILGGLSKVIIRESCQDTSSMRDVLENVIGIRNLFLLSAIAICIISSFFTGFELQIKLYIVLLSADIFQRGITNFLSTIYQVVEKMQYITIFNIISRLFFVSLSILFLSLGYGVLSLFLIHIFVNYLTLLVNYKASDKFVSFKFFSKVKFDSKILKPAVLFSLFSILTVFSTRIDLLMISLLGTSNDVGVYAVAYRVVMMGLMLRNVNATAFYPIFIKRFHRSKVNGRKLIKYSLLLLMMMIVFSLIFSLFCEDLITFFFGKEYRESGKILRILIFFLVSVWATLPFTIAAQATHNEKVMLIIRAVMAGLNIPFNYFLFLKFGPIGIAYSTLIIWGFGSIAMCIFPYRLMKNQGHLV